MDSTDGWVDLKAPVTADQIYSLASQGPLDKVALQQNETLTAKVTKALDSLESLKQFWVWCPVTRRAMRDVVTISGLQILDVLWIQAPGRLTAFEDAVSLQSFRCNCSCLTQTDLLEVARCKSIKILGAQGAALSARVIEGLLAMPTLEELDLEGARVADDIGSKRIGDHEVLSLSTSKTIIALDLGSTNVSRRGVEAISKMKQLRRLDLWATKIEEVDLELLSALPSLEYLAIGQPFDGKGAFDLGRILPTLRLIPSLTDLWLHGVNFAENDKLRAQEHFNKVRISRPEPADAVSGSP